MSATDDVSRLLFTVFSDSEVSKIRKSDLVRFWSLEMQWFNPDESNLVLDRLVERFWLKENDDFIELVGGVTLLSSELGWRPITRRMLDPPINENRNELSSEVLSFDENKLSRPIIKESQNINKQTNEIYPLDGAEESIPFLIKQIAKKSGLSNNEVVRRAQRKRRALEPITLWMALALVAREQGVDMEQVATVLLDFKK
tara:strand:+ start:11570 stop:12169 length:600 start_codon:yes stop_codon:yes gene_type:complete